MLWHFYAVSANSRVKTFVHALAIRIAFCYKKKIIENQLMSFWTKSDRNIKC